MYLSKKPLIVVCSCLLNRTSLLARLINHPPTGVILVVGTGKDAQRKLDLTTFKPPTILPIRIESQMKNQDAFRLKGTKHLVSGKHRPTRGTGQNRNFRH